MTFLELVQDLARETGTMENADPTNATISTLQSPDNDYLIDLIRWVRKAWVDIQLMHDHWRFMTDQAQINTTADDPSIDLSAEVADFRRLVPYIHPFRHPWIRIGDDRSVFQVPYREWAGAYDRLSHSDGLPRRFTIDPDDEMQLWPVPNDAYQLTFDYLRTVQELSADADEPTMPARFHDAIVYRAMVKYAGYDEASTQYDRAKRELRSIMIRLQNEQLPDLRID